MARANVDREWIHRHFIHHRDGSYLVIPNLYAADPSNEQEAAKALAMNHLAGVLADLDVVRWPTKREGKQLRAEEGVSSTSDLSAVRKKWREEHKLQPMPGAEHGDRPIRNHGLFSKAEHALQMAGWSERARNDVEVFRLVDTDGLTPVLMALNEAGSPDGSRGRETPRPTEPRGQPA